MNIYTFFITSLIIILLPGSGVIYTVSTGITKGKKASVLAVIGCTLGIIPHICASIALSSLLLNMSSQAFGVMKLAGSLYLLYLGVKMLFSKTKLEINKPDTKEKPSTIIKQGILINLLNPKLTLFFFSFLPQYVSIHSQNFIVKSFLYGSAFMLLSFLIFIVYGILAGTMSNLITKSPTGLQRIQQLFGILFIAFAIQLGLSTI